MLRTALKAGIVRLPQRAANGGAAAEAGRRTFSSLQDALVKVTFVDADVRAHGDLKCFTLLCTALSRTLQCCRARAAVRELRGVSLEIRIPYE